MKILFDYYRNYYSFLNISLSAYTWKSKQKLPYKAYTLEIVLFGCLFIITFISNYKAYKKKLEQDKKVLYKFWKQAKAILNSDSKSVSVQEQKEFFGITNKNKKNYN